MWLETLTSPAPSAVAIVVPWLTFRYALRREQRQWSREQRTQVYVDLLVEASVEASAEQDWLIVGVRDASKYWVPGGATTVEDDRRSAGVHTVSRSNRISRGVRGDVA
jgi:hypothetical protein